MNKFGLSSQLPQIFKLEFLGEPLLFDTDVMVPKLELDLQRIVTILFLV